MELIARSKGEQVIFAMEPRMLLAASPELRIRLMRALRGYPMTCAATSPEVRAALAAQHFDLIVVGTHFEEFRALDMLEEVRRTVPDARIVCVRGLPFRLVGRPAMDALRLACEALGASLVIDLLDYPEDEAGDRAIRALFEQQLAAA